jgi:hypothetical protein
VQTYGEIVGELFPGVRPIVNVLQGRATSIISKPIPMPNSVHCPRSPPLPASQAIILRHCIAMCEYADRGHRYKLNERFVLVHVQVLSILLL